MNLDLKPVAAPSAGLVEAIGPFGHETLETLFASRLHQRLALTRDVLTNMQMVTLWQDALQQLPPPRQRQIRQIVAIQMQEVEGVINQPPRAGANVVLERLKIRSTRFIDHHHFPIDDGG